jgi:hypothetical protein
MWTMDNGDGIAQWVFGRENEGMSQEPNDSEDYPPEKNEAVESGSDEARPIRKFTARLTPGRNLYDLKHNFDTEDVIVQTRIAGNIRDGGISIVDKNRVRITFGGPLHEAMDVVIIG